MLAWIILSTVRLSALSFLAIIVGVQDSFCNRSSIIVNFRIVVNFSQPCSNNYYTYVVFKSFNKKKLRLLDETAGVRTIRSY